MQEAFSKDSILVQDDNSNNNYQYIRGGQQVPINHSLVWVTKGLLLFRKSIGKWILISLFFILPGFIPIKPTYLNFIWIFLAPLFSAGLMQGCHDLRLGKPLRVLHIFAGVHKAFFKLLLVGFLYFSIPIILAKTSGTRILHNPYWMSDCFANIAAHSIFLYGLAILFLIISCIAMAWIAPGLIILENELVLDAIKSSYYRIISNIASITLTMIFILLLALICMLVFSIPVFLAQYCLPQIFSSSWLSILMFAIAGTILPMFGITYCITYSAIRDIFYTSGEQRS